MVAIIILMIAAPRIESLNWDNDTHMSKRNRKNKLKHDHSLADMEEFKALPLSIREAYVDLIRANASAMQKVMEDPDDKVQEDVKRAIDGMLEGMQQKTDELNAVTNAEGYGSLARGVFSRNRQGVNIEMAEEVEQAN
jgi:hypothetical protein